MMDLDHELQVLRFNALCTLKKNVSIKDSLNVAASSRQVEDTILSEQGIQDSTRLRSNLIPIVPQDDIFDKPSSTKQSGINVSARNEGSAGSNQSGKKSANFKKRNSSLKRDSADFLEEDFNYDEALNSDDEENKKKIPIDLGKKKIWDCEKEQGMDDNDEFFDAQDDPFGFDSDDDPFLGSDSPSDNLDMLEDSNDDVDSMLSKFEEEINNPDLLLRNAKMARMYNAKQSKGQTSTKPKVSGTTALRDSPHTSSANKEKACIDSLQDLLDSITTSPENNSQPDPDDENGGMGLMMRKIVGEISKKTVIQSRHDIQVTVEPDSSRTPKDDHEIRLSRKRVPITFSPPKKVPTSSVRPTLVPALNAASSSLSIPNVGSSSLSIPNVGSSSLSVPNVGSSSRSVANVGPSSLSKPSVRPYSLSQTAGPSLSSKPCAGSSLSKSLVMPSSHPKPSAGSTTRTKPTAELSTLTKPIAGPSTLSNPTRANPTARTSMGAKSTTGRSTLTMPTTGPSTNIKPVSGPSTFAKPAARPSAGPSTLTKPIAGPSTLSKPTAGQSTPSKAIIATSTLSKRSAAQSTLSKLTAGPSTLSNASQVTSTISKPTSISKLSSVSSTVFKQDAGPSLVSKLAAESSLPLKSGSLLEANKNKDLKRAIVFPDSGIPAKRVTPTLAKNEVPKSNDNQPKRPPPIVFDDSNAARKIVVTKSFAAPSGESDLKGVTCKVDSNGKRVITFNGSDTKKSSGLVVTQRSPHKPITFAKPVIPNSSLDKLEARRLRFEQNRVVRPLGRRVRLIRNPAADNASDNNFGDGAGSVSQHWLNATSRRGGHIAPRSNGSPISANRMNLTYGQYNMLTSSDPDRVKRLSHVPVMSATSTTPDKFRVHLDDDDDDEDSDDVEFGGVLHG